MQKEVKYKGNIDYAATLAQLEEVGQYVIVPTSDSDISAIRTAVTKAARGIEGAQFSVHKTVNGARIQRNA